MLEQIPGHLDFLNEGIVRISEEVASCLDPYCRQIELLRTIPGMDRKTAEVILSEIGPDMGHFPTARPLASWAGLCPGNHESAGKRKNGETRKGNRWLRRALIEAGWAASHTKDTYLSAQYRRLVTRRGAKKAIVAIAHSLLVIAYHALKNDVSYQELGANYLDKLDFSMIQRHHVKRLENLGFKVTIEPVTKAA
jgi:transposase